MIILASLLFAIFLASLGWLIAGGISKREILEARASAAFAGSQPKLESEEDLIKLSSQKGIVAFKDCKGDHFREDLFLSGVRNKNRLILIASIRQWVIFSPLLYLALKLIEGRLDGITLFYGVIAFLFLHAASAMAARSYRVRRQRRIRRHIPELFDLLIVCFEAGLSFMAALPRGIMEFNKEEPLVSELDILNSEFLAGLSLEAACDRTAERCQVPELSRILSAIVQSDRMGSSLAGTLRVQIGELRDKLKQLTREKAHKIPVKLIFPIALMLVGVLLPLLFGSVFFNLMRALNSM